MSNMNSNQDNHRIMRAILAGMVLWAATLFSTTAQTSPCTIQGTDGTDFWVTFMPGEPDATSLFSLIASGKDTAHITVHNPVTGYSQTWFHNSGTKTYMELPSSIQNMPSASVSDKGFHVTSTSPVYLFVSNYKAGCWDIANVLPTEGLGVEYIVQDYSQNDGDASKPPVMALVATEDGTVVTMTVPCPVVGMSMSQVGSIVTYNLNEGQSLMLKASTMTSFSGMEISSNKTIAVFQGNMTVRVGTINTGRDYLLEQARPLDLWGTEFIAASTLNRHEGDLLVVTAGADDCQVGVNDTLIAILQRGDTCIYYMPTNSTARIVTTQPAYVCMYTWSYDNGGSLGDPSSVSINPVSRWICSADFPVHNCNTNTSNVHYITDDHHYINIYATADAMDSLRLDGQLVTGAQTISGGYKYLRRNIVPGAHSIYTTNGTFMAHVYGCGKWVQYNFELGLYIEVEHDTVEVYDTICKGRSYNNLGLSLSGFQTQTAGDFVYERNYQGVFYVFHITVLPTWYVNVYDSIAPGDTLHWNGYDVTAAGNYSVTLTAANGCDSTVTLHVVFLGSTIHVYDTVCAGVAYTGHGFVVDNPEAGEMELVRDTVENGAPNRYVLHLTVLPVSRTFVEISVIMGDAAEVCDTQLTVAGVYVFHYTAANGCDSTVTVHLVYEPVGINASATGVCPGSAVTLTATGTHTYVWSSEPYDAELESQQGRNPVTVHPMQTTTYRLLDEAGNVVSTVTVGAEEKPTLCVEVNRDILDFDNPVLLFTDCSEGQYSTRWQFADGHLLTGEKVRRRYLHPLPDSAVVTMTSCNQFNCCADTTIAIPMKINSVWFPNIFTPEADNNNLFQCFTSFDVDVFELVIYNRWGLLVWSSEDVAQGWDGRCLDGTPCPQGAYAYRYYLKAVDGTVRSGHGSVTLLR